MKCGLRCTYAFPLGVSLHIGAGVSFDFFGLLSPWGILMLHTCVFYMNFSSRTCLLLSTCGFLCSWRLLFIGRLLFIYCVRLLDFSNNPGDLTRSLLFIVVSIVNPGGGGMQQERSRLQQSGWQSFSSCAGIILIKSQQSQTPPNNTILTQQTQWLTQTQVNGCLAVDRSVMRYSLWMPGGRHTQNSLQILDIFS